MSKKENKKIGMLLRVCESAKFDMDLLACNKIIDLIQEKDSNEGGTEWKGWY